MPEPPMPHARPSSSRPDRPELDSSGPDGVLPATWLERVFELMAAHYGGRFAALWRGADVQSVKAVWGRALGRLSAAQLKRGIAALEQQVHAPTLPEFIALCKQAAPQAHCLKLPAPRPTPEQREQARQRFAAMKQSLARVPKGRAHEA